MFTVFLTLIWKLWPALGMEANSRPQVELAEQIVSKTCEVFKTSQVWKIAVDSPATVEAKAASFPRRYGQHPQRPKKIAKT